MTHTDTSKLLAEGRKRVRVKMESCDVNVTEL